MFDKNKSKYKRGTNPQDVPDTPTPTGYTSRQLVIREDLAQQRVAENPEWLLARRVNYAAGKYQQTDSRPFLQSMGIEVDGAHNDLFYKTKPPEGWTKETEGYWTYVRDNAGNQRLTQFYKGAHYDRDAFINVEDEKK
jgi:hypothetical protein